MERQIKGFTALLFTAGMLFTANAAYAQEQNRISIATETVSRGEKSIVQVTVSANAVEKIQGISFQLRYDSACLQPSGFQSLVLNLNNTSMPQSPGVVDGIFTSTEPLSANGGMVNVNFTPITACENTLALIKADLIVLSVDGFAEPLADVVVDTTPVVVAVSAGQLSGSAEPTQSMSVLDAESAPIVEATEAVIPRPIVEEKTSPSTMERLVVIGAGILVLFAGILAAIVYTLMRGKKVGRRGQHRRAQAYTQAEPSKTPRISANEVDRYLSIRHGIQAGTRVKLENFPFAIGYSQANDLRLEDPSISAFHAKLFLKDGKVILVDLGNPIGTNVNGNTIRNQKIEIKNGDVIKIGAVVLAFSVM